MTSVVELRTGATLRRVRHSHQSDTEDFRDDVLTYGGLIYESLRMRRDLDASDADVDKKIRRRQKAEASD